jgi:hypothetical protein
MDCREHDEDPKARFPRKSVERHSALSYGWRKQSMATARGGFYAEVEKFWCTTGDDVDEDGRPDEDAAGWRWSGFDINEQGKPGALRTNISAEMSFSDAMTEAENWIQKQIDARIDLAPYRFAGLEARSAP